jgi:DNA-binding transcriptional MerR regulator
VGERSYLAIGDVLALLRDEFPDITISKIRFLESRGLLVPERTPSGYRKFYEPDVERLRWILRQQREHFLPLKVIKGRLDHGMSDPEAPAPHLFEVGEPPPERESEALLVAAAGASALTRENAQGALAALTPVAMITSSADRTAKRASAPVTGRTDPAPQAEHGSPTAPTGSAPEGGSEEQQATTGRRPAEAETKPAGAGGGRRAKGQAPVPESAEPETAEESSSNDAPAEEAQEDPAVRARHPLSRPTAGLPGAGLSGASLTLAELANASGLEAAGIEELESFGLIAGRTVAGVHCYDEEAVLVAKLAARFAPYGIGARHLRIFKHAADRQTGLFAQVVTPLLRQRNPGARARAVEELSELSELGEALMRCFSQAAQRELTGG